MPNTLVHFATQGALTRGWWRGLDARWIYLGCLLPDVPWILRRAVVGFGFPADPFDLRLFSMAQASWAGTLLLCAALAALSAAPRLVFTVLGVNALAHLLLDATEVKWGNGVHLFAPFSWRMTSFDLVSGEGVVFPILALAGALLVGWEIVRRAPERAGFDLRPRRLFAAGALLGAYLLAPVAFLGPLQASDSYSVKTMREKPLRPGRTVHFDRTGLVQTPGGPVIETWTGERLRAAGPVPDHDALISLRGTFLEPDVVHVDRFVEHHSSRDWPSYVALVLLGVLWVRPCLPGARGPSPRVTGFS